MADIVESGDGSDEPTPEPVAVCAFRALYGERVSDPLFVIEKWRLAFQARKRIEDEWSTRVEELRQQFLKTEAQRRNAVKSSRTMIERVVIWWTNQKSAAKNAIPWNRKMPSGDPARHEEWLEFLASWLNRRLLAQQIGRVFSRSDANILVDMLRCSDREFAVYVDKLRKDPEKWVRFFGE